MVNCCRLAHKLTKKGIKLKGYLRNLNYAHIIVAVMIMYILKLEIGLIELISPIILSIGISQNNYWNILIYFILNVMGIMYKSYYLVKSCIAIGFLESFNRYPLIKTLEVLVIVFYIIANTFAWKAYEEFKESADLYPYEESSDSESNQELPSFNERLERELIRDYRAPPPLAGNARRI
ncbi:unnamed protein product [Moneuplotes crassus]|uniref:Uncharacterized protein n=1 Tax=Euplotes crassus TaxID=5936 RepID=A0AAD1XYX6_EUPCR|nr:unnamed protein product [Moneuplotes crassus]